MQNMYHLNTLRISLKLKFLPLLLLLFISVVANAQNAEINVKRLTADKLTGSTYSFLDQNVKTSGSALAFTIYNEGSENLTIADITLSGVNADQFKLNKTQTAASVAPGETTTFTIAFAPTSTSPEQKNAALTISNNDSNESAYTINMTGKAVINAPIINAINGISPTSGAVGASITINGKELINTDNVYFTGPNSSQIEAQFTINTNTKITVTVPANAVTGVIGVKNASGIAPSSEIFTFLDTYTWNKTSGNWSDPNSWAPARTTPATTDILIFNGINSGSTAIMTAIVDFASPQTVGQLKFIENANVTFTVAEDKTLYIGTNASGTDFSVEDGSKLIVTNSVADADLTINIMPGETGIVVGAVTFQGIGLAEHRLIANNSTTGGNTLVFQTGSTFTAGGNFSGSPFGSIYANSVQFSSNSIYYNQSPTGGSPFGSSTAVVVFDPNTNYRHDINTIPDLINRTYGIFTINNANFNQIITGTGNLTIQRDLTLTSAIAFNLNLTGTIIIGRNLKVDKGALKFEPASASTIKLDGSGITSKAVTISGTNGTLSLGTNANLSIETGAIVTLSKNITGSGSVTVNGTVKTANTNGLSGGALTTFVNTLQPLTLNPGSTVEYYGTGIQTISAIDYVNLTISGARASKIITLPNILKVAGVFSPTATDVSYTTNNTIEFNGGAQTIPAFNYNNISVFGTGDKSLSEDVTVNGNLNLLANKIITGSNILTLGPGATITGEATGRYVVGTLKATRPVGSSGSNFGGMGITLGSGVNVGEVTVIRTSGPGSSVQVKDKQGINRKWEVLPSIQPTSPISVTLSWIGDDDNNGINELERDLTAMRVWKTDGTGKYIDVSGADQNVGTNRTITASVSSFSTLTVSDQNNPLPVELISFNVLKKGSNAVLTWQTASEKNNLGFAVEISSDAKIFREVGFVKSVNPNANTLQNYEFTHRAVSAGTVYYRLKQTDWDGATKYYEPKAIRFDQAATTVLAYPNPVTGADKEVAVIINGSMNEKAIITVTDALGKTIYRQTEAITPAQTELKINLNRQPAGVYLINVTTPTGTTQAKIVKQ